MMILGRAKEMRKHMGFQMVHFNQRHMQSQRQSLGKRHPDKQGSQQARPSGKGNRVYLFLADPGCLQSRIHHRHDILHMGPGSQLGHHPAVHFMHFLAGNHVGKQKVAVQDSGRSIVAGRFYGKDAGHVFIISTFVLLIWLFCTQVQNTRKRCKNSESRAQSKRACSIGYAETHPVFDDSQKQ